MLETTVCHVLKPHQCLENKTTIKNPTSTLTGKQARNLDGDISIYCLILMLARPQVTPSPAERQQTHNTRALTTMFARLTAQPNRITLSRGLARWVRMRIHSNPCAVGKWSIRTSA